MPSLETSDLIEARESFHKETKKETIDLTERDSDLIPVQDIRAFQSQYLASPELRFHKRIGLGNLNSFSEGMIRIHSRFIVDKYPHLRSLNCCGTRSGLAGVFHLSKTERSSILAFDLHYPSNYRLTGEGFGVPVALVPHRSGGSAPFDLDAAKLKLDQASSKSKVKTVLVDCPGALVRVLAGEVDWREIIEFCLEHECRLIVDGTWSALAGKSHFPLALVAKEYSELEWAEFYSVSRTFSDPGARLTVIVGSRGLIDRLEPQIELWDGGPCPALMTAYGEFLKDFHRAGKVIEDTVRVYQSRVREMHGWLDKLGFERVSETGPSFFLAMKAPSQGTDPVELQVRLMREAGLCVDWIEDADKKPLFVFSAAKDITGPKLKRELEQRFSQISMNR